MTLTELRYLVALHQHQHFARAAEACHVTQSTLSAGLKQLESQLDVTLVERSRHFLRFTPLGEVFVQRAQELLAQADDLLALTKASDPLQGEIKLGIIYTIAPYLLPQLITPWRQQAPSAPLHITEGFTHELLTQLDAGSLDAIIIALPFDGTDRFSQWPLYDEPFVAVLPESHHLAQHTHLTTNDIRHESLLILGRGHCFRDHALSALPVSQGSTPWQALIEGSSLETLRAMVAGGLGITLLPELAARAPWPGLVSRPLADPPPHRQVVLLTRPSQPRQSALQQLADCIVGLRLT